MINQVKKIVMFVFMAMLISVYSNGQVASQAAPKPQINMDAFAPPQSASGDGESSHGVGAAFRISTLGVGGEVAVQVARNVNVRGGVNFFSYSRGYDNNGIHYQGDLRWFSTEAHLDVFPFATHGFHLSPGILAYNDNHVNAAASVPGGTDFTLNGVSYQSDPTNPVLGTAKLSFNKTAPTFMIGFGNLVPRKGSKHFSFNIEAGVAFAGSPKIALGLTGGACLPDGTNCQDIGSTPSIQSNVQGEQTKISDDLSPFKYYPLVSLSIGYKF